MSKPESQDDVPWPAAQTVPVNSRVSVPSPVAVTGTVYTRPGVTGTSTPRAGPDAELVLSERSPVSNEPGSIASSNVTVNAPGLLGPAATPGRVGRA